MLLGLRNIQGRTEYLYSELGFAEFPKLPSIHGHYPSLTCPERHYEANLCSSAAMACRSTLMPVVIAAQAFRRD